MSSLVPGASSGREGAEEEDLPSAGVVVVDSPLQGEDIGCPSGAEPPNVERAHRRRHCPSFRLLLRRQLWVNTVRVAATLRRLFRPRRPTLGAKGHKGEIPSGGEAPSQTPSPSRRIFPSLIDGKVGPAESTMGAGSPRGAALGEPHVVSSPPASPSPGTSPAKTPFGVLFRRGSPAPGPPQEGLGEPNVQHMRLARSRRLLREFRELSRAQMAAREPVFTVDLVNDCLYEWKVKLYRIDPESELCRDMIEFNVPYILLNISFPEAFPFQPPFLRVLAPRLEKGFVMEGGAICMELLTPRGWASAYTIEAVVMQFAASLVKGQGRISRKAKASKEFNRRAAEASFRSLVKTHDKYGWVTPPLAEG